MPVHPQVLACLSKKLPALLLVRIRFDNITEKAQYTTRQNVQTKPYYTHAASLTKREPSPTAREGLPGLVKL